MRDIAERLGLSQTTVSHVLAGNHERFRISRETVDKVWRMAGKMRYRSNALARAFRERRSRSVALAVEDLTNPFWTGLAVGAEHEADRLGYTLVVSNTGGSLQKEQQAARMLEEGRVDGLILAPIRQVDPYLSELYRAGRPIVQIDRPLRNLDVACVRTDHAAGSVLAVEHLAGRRHARIAYVGGPLRVPTYRQRREGFRRAMRRRGLKPAAEIAVDPTPEAAHRAVSRLLSGSPRPSALYTANIWLTLGALRAIQESGLAVPAQIDVVGFDDIQMADLLRYPVTTIAQDVESIGREAFKVLMQVMKGRKVPREVLLPPALIVR
jgi:LacI family transcriptional regulator